MRDFAYPFEIIDNRIKETSDKEKTLFSEGDKAEIEITTVNAGVITEISIISPGRKYTPNPILTIESVSGVNAVLTPIVNIAGGIQTITIENGGTGYTLEDTITLSHVIDIDKGIRERILMLINMLKTERLFRADYGIGLDLLFRNLESDVLANKTIVDAISLYIPEASITLQDVEVSVENSTLQINIKYFEGGEDRSISGVIG